MPNRRQGGSCGDEKVEGERYEDEEGKKEEQKEEEAVSYTHLDVYKRQGILSTIIEETQIYGRNLIL